MKEGSIKTLTLLVQTKFLSLVDATYKNKKGEDKHWIIASRKNFQTLEKQYLEGKADVADAVVIVAFHEESKKLVLIKQFRVPINDYIYELPAGLIDPEEDLKSTLIRELKEETGLEFLETKENLSKHKVYLSPGMTDESAALVFCTCKGEISNKYLEEDEDIEAVLVSPQEAKVLLESHAKMDIKLVVVLQSFIRLGEKMFMEKNL